MRLFDWRWSAGGGLFSTRPKSRTAATGCRSTGETPVPPAQAPDEGWPQEVTQCPDCGRVLLECRCGGPDGQLTGSIRPARLGDLTPFAEAFRTRPEQLAAMLAAQRTWCLVAHTRRGTPVAAAVLTSRRYGYTLRRFAVLPEWRRRRIGHELLADIRYRLRDDRGDWLVMIVPETAVDLQCFLRSEGFLHETTIRPKPDAIDQRDVYAFRWETQTPHGAKFVPTHRLRHLLSAE